MTSQPKSDDLDRLVISDPFMIAFALTLARRVHGGGAMVLGLYVETMVAAALGGEPGVPRH